jgi:hypothetical protein
LPITRFSAMLLAEGWSKRTLWPAPMLKLCQVMASLSVLCVTSNEVAEGWLTVPAPAVTRPSAGRLAWA